LPELIYLNFFRSHQFPATQIEYFNHGSGPLQAGAPLYFNQAMNATSIFIIALALAVDAFAVALAAGVTLPRVSLRHTFRLAWHFGLFQ
jgi:hypothetical protein